MLRSQRGFSLIQSIMAVGLLGFVSMGLLSYFEFYLKTQQNVKEQSQLTSLRQILLAHVQNGQAWNTTVTHTENTFSSCKESLDHCPVEAPHPLVLFDPAGNVVLNSRNYASGFTEANLPCTSFSQSSDCAIQVKASWKPVCGPGGECTQAQLDFNFFRSRPGAQPESVSEFDFSIFKNVTFPSMNQNRQVTIPVTSSVTTTYPRLKLFLIIDHSSTMADNQAKLKSGLQTMLQQLAGYNVDIFVYTTTSLPNDTWSPGLEGSAREPTKVFRLSSTPIYTLEDGTEVVGTEPADWKSKTVLYELRQDLGEYLGLDMSIDYYDSDISPVIANVMSAIDFAGTDGSGYESGICTMMRIVHDEQKLQAGDKAAFVILSDEDDYMNQGPFESGYCKRGIYEQWVQSTGYTTCDPNVETCDYKTYKITGTLYTPEDDTSSYSPVNSADVMVDPDPYWYYQNTAWAEFTGVDNSGMVNVRICQSSVYAECPARASTTCTASDLDLVAQEVELRYGITSFTIDSCTVNRYSDSFVRLGNGERHGWSPGETLPFSFGEMRWPRVQTTPMDTLTIGTPEHDAALAEYNADWCTDPFTYEARLIRTGAMGSYVYEDRTWSGLRELAEAAYLSPVKSIDSCTAKHWKRSTHTYLSERNLLFDRYSMKYGIAANDLFRGDYWGDGDYMLDTAERKLGSDGFFLTAIIHDDVKDAAAGCTVTDGSPGLGYEQLIGLSPTPLNIESICGSSYNAGLADIESFIQQTSFETQYIPDLQDTEYISKVELMRNSSAVTLLDGDYTIIGSTIQFADGILQAGDEIIVTISPK